MTRVVVTGAAGFLGQRLARALIEAGELVGRDGVRRPISELCLVDLAEVAPPPAADLKVETRRGDLSDPAFLDALAAEGFDSLFHLASYLTLHAEKEPSRAFMVNVEALRRLVAGADGSPKVVFTSSIAVFGGELPEAVGDDVAPAPATTYGTHKAVNELLIADHSRHGHIDGRSLRLPIVLTRPGTPQPAVSDRVAAIVREPLLGLDVAVPLSPETPLAVVSAGAVARALVRLHDLPGRELPSRRVFNLPALNVTVAELAEAVRRHGATGRISYEPDAQMEAIVGGWPRRFVSEHAGRLGIHPDPDLDALIADHLEHGHG